MKKSTEPISTKLGTKHPWVKGIQVSLNEESINSHKGNSGFFSLNQRYDIIICVIDLNGFLRWAMWPMGLLFFCYLFFGVIFLVSHYLTIFTKSYLQNTQNIESPLQTVKVLTTDLVMVLESSFGEDSFGFTVWVLVNMSMLSFQWKIARAVLILQESNPKNILLSWNLFRVLLKDSTCIHGVDIILRGFVYHSLV